MCDSSGKRSREPQVARLNRDGFTLLSGDAGQVARAARLRSAGTGHSQAVVTEIATAVRVRDDYFDTDGFAAAPCAASSISAATSLGCEWKTEWLAPGTSTTLRLCILAAYQRSRSGLMM
jgi:hypothetical protein